MKDGTGVRKCPASVTRGRKHNVVILAPYCIQSPIGSDNAIKSLGRPVIIARQTRMRVYLDWIRPCFSVIGRSRKNHLRIRQAPSSPTYVQVAGVFALCVVHNNIRLVLEWNSRSTRLFCHWDMVCFPGLPTIQRTSHKDTVAGCAMCPVVEGTELVKCDVADESVSLIVERVDTSPEIL